MLKKIVLGVALVLAIFFVVVAFQSSDFRVERGIPISAPPEKVFSQINDLHRWEAWSPWQKRDPQATFTYEGAESGIGAIFSWAGNRNMGEGRMTIVESNPNSSLRIQLDFLKPFKGTNEVDFILTPHGDETAVTWTMTGKRNFVTKLIGMFMDMDKMIGDDFDEGLIALKGAVEGGEKK